MKYVKAAIEHGEVVEKEVIIKNQSEMNSDCFMVQFEGL
jgi:hypothetical protein